MRPWFMRLTRQTEPGGHVGGNRASNHGMEMRSYKNPVTKVVGLLGCSISGCLYAWNNQHISKACNSGLGTDVTF